MSALDPAYPGEVARRYGFDDGGGEIGFISSVTQPFCGDCSRARLSSDGKFYTCLFAAEGTDLRAPLRGGATDEELLALMRAVWERRADRYSELRENLRAKRRAACRNELRRGLRLQCHAVHASRPDSRIWMRAPRPTMVDVGAKAVTHRIAEAEARVRLPAAVARALRRSGHRTKQGPVFDTAIVAGVMAAKRTAELIPFCHPLALEHCRIDIEFAPGAGAAVIVVHCRVEVRHKTGVEMEALTGASVAALTIYDMCKALSHDIRIVQCAAALQERRQAAGGCTRRGPRARSGPRSIEAGRMSAPDLYGLVLTGGRSRRMQRDKASLQYAGKPQLARAMELLTPLVARCFVSVRPDQLLRSAPRRL